jgi:hypothetical protein
VIRGKALSFRIAILLALLSIACSQNAPGADVGEQVQATSASFSPASVNIQKSICDQFPKNLSQTEVENLTARVKDAFPAKYRAKLDSVAVKVLPDSNIELNIATIGDRYELSISSGYARNLCVLMMATLPVGPAPPPVDDTFTFQAENCREGEPRFSCLIAKLDGLNEAREKQSAAASLIAKWEKSIRVTLRSALLYGLAHEYGHVIGDIDPNLIPKQNSIDPEFVADIAGLYIITSGLAAPQVDGIYFGGMRVVDLAKLTNQAASYSHEPTICRAKRTNQIRRLLLPSLVKIYGWTHTDSKVNFFGTDAAEGRIIQFAYPDVSLAACNDPAISALTPVVDDLNKLSKIAVSLPYSEKLLPEQIDQLDRVIVKTGFGRSLHSGMLLEAKLAQPEVVQNLNGRGDPRNISAVFEALLRGDRYLDTPSDVYMSLMASLAAGRFAAHPRGYSFQRAAQQLDAELRSWSVYGTTNLYFVMMSGLSAIMNGRCNEGVRKFATLGDAINEAKRDFQPSYPGQELQQLTLGVYVTESIPIAQNIIRRGELLPPNICEAMSEELATTSKQAYGWVD